MPFDRCCWHSVDPGTVLFTGSVNRNVECSGSWLAEYEYVIDDVNKWWFLARSGRLAGATSLATHGDLNRSARYRSQTDFGIGLGDELRGSFVADDRYWGAAGFLRDSDQPWFTDDDVRFLASLSKPLAQGIRSALIANVGHQRTRHPAEGPGVVVFDEGGQPEFISPRPSTGSRSSSRSRRRTHGGRVEDGPSGRGTSAHARPRRRSRSSSPPDHACRPAPVHGSSSTALPSPAAATDGPR